MTNDVDKYTTPQPQSDKHIFIYQRLTVVLSSWKKKKGGLTPKICTSFVLSC